MNGFVFGTGAFAGFLLADILWRILYRQTAKLIAELAKFIEELTGGGDD
jgi:hypothetical protein